MQIYILVRTKNTMHNDDVETDVTVFTDENAALAEMTKQYQDKTAAIAENGYHLFENFCECRKNDRYAQLEYGDDEYVWEGRYSWKIHEKEIGTSVTAKTPIGTLLAESCTDPLRPGISIDLVKDGFHRNIACVEYSDDDLKAYLWADADCEDYTHKIIYGKEDE